MSELKVYPCGTLVKTKIGSIEGMIICSSVRFDKIQYEIAYFISGEQKCVWMQEAEFYTTDKKEKLGFK